jgi:outer membrane immunogenic protein
VGRSLTMTKQRTVPNQQHLHTIGRKSYSGFDWHHHRCDGSSIFYVGGRAVNRIFFTLKAAAFAAVLIAAPAGADEAPQVKSVRHVERAAPARAAPSPVSTPARPNWTGGQIGGQGGVAQMAQGFAEPGAHLYPTCGIFGSFPGSYCVETPFSFNGNKTGATGGGFLGYRIQFGTVVAGIEGDINAKSASSSYSLTDSNAYRTETFFGTAKQGGDSSIRGRFGFLITPWVLAYGTVGAAFGNASGSFNYSGHEIGCRFGELCVYGGCPTMRPCASAIGGGSWSTTRAGAMGGAGIETMITPLLTLRLEYRYTDLGSFAESVPLHAVCSTTCSSPSSSATINLHPTFQAVTVGVGYNF